MRLLRWPLYNPHASRRQVRGRDAGIEVLFRQRVRVGLPLAVLCAWLAEPSPVSLALGALIALLGVLVRGLAASHLPKHAGLATSGPYALTRNPLYFGSAIVAAGLLVAAHSWIAGVLGAGYFAVFYPPTMRREERRLRARYGSAFDDYAARVPRFWPRLAAASSAGFSWSWGLYGRNGEYTAAAGVAIGLAVLWLKMWSAS
jgi:protein-S-isoprenylcysteine O-methyltransferase Ste14